MINNTILIDQGPSTVANTSFLYLGGNGNSLGFSPQTASYDKDNKMVSVTYSIRDTYTGRYYTYRINIGLA